MATVPDASTTSTASPAADASAEGLRPDTCHTCGHRLTKTPPAVLAWQRERMNVYRAAKRVAKEAARGKEA